MDFTLIPIDKILDNIDDPFGRWTTNRPVTVDEVMEAFTNGSDRAAAESYSHETPGNMSVLWHANRIAYLMRNGWDDPIDIDVGIPSLGYYPYILTDGHHRLCAAILTGERFIKAQVSGSVDYAFELFGVDCSLYSTTGKTDVH
jgi:hypothetical protein